MVSRSGFDAPSKVLGVKCDNGNSSSSFDAAGSCAWPSLGFGTSSGTCVFGSSKHDEIYGRTGEMRVPIAQDGLPERLLLVSCL